MKLWTAAVFTLSIIDSQFMAFSTSANAEPEYLPVEPPSLVYMETNIGQVIIQLTDLQSPMAAKQFSNLVTEGFYHNQSFYRVIDSKTLENVYKLKIMNKSSVPQSYIVTASGLNGEMEVVVDSQYQDRISEAGEVLNLPVKVRAKKSDVTRHIQTIKLHIHVNSENGTVVTEKTKYFGPRHK